ncbi:MAG: hypothetical protein JXB85_04415 [Anaerolineales bacterium]|nr:hypothetical protein [Anaerolineales bacterium]
MPARNRLALPISDPETRRRAQVIILTAAWMAVACALMIAWWILTSSLESIYTALAAGILCLLLGGIIVLACRERVTLAGWLLVSLTTLLVFAASSGYGLGTPSTAGYLIPIVLAGLVLGSRAGYAVTAACVLAVWGVGAAAWQGWFEPWIPFDISHLTFNAPLYSLLFALIAVMVGQDR